jgi:hypothetical protein
VSAWRVIFGSDGLWGLGFGSLGVTTIGVWVCPERGVGFFFGYVFRVPWLGGEGSIGAHPAVD